MNKRRLCNILIYWALGLIVVSWLSPIFGVSTNYSMLGVWTIILILTALMGYLGKLSINQKEVKG